MHTDDEMEGRYYPTRLTIPPEVQVETIEILNQSLANTIDLWMQVKCSYWNVKGMQFFSLHQLFQELSDQLNSFTDLIGERVAILGGDALGTVHMAVGRSQIPPYPNNLTTGKEHITAIAQRMALYSKQVSKNIEIAQGLGEVNTADIYTEISRAVDKSLWLLEAHLQT